MRYLGAKELLVIHSEIIDQTGGLHGVGDIHLLQSIIEKPKGHFGGKELYKGIFLKAAVYLQSLVQYHVFLDGNKRTAIGVISRFLFLNGYDLQATNTEVERLILKIATQNIKPLIVASWLEKHSIKLR